MKRKMIGENGFNENSVKVGVNLKELLLIGEQILLKTKERPFLIGKLDTLHCLVEVNFIWIDIPKKIGSVYGYEVIAIPNDDNILKNNQIYVWEKEKTKQFVLSYLSNKYKLLFKEMLSW